MAYRTLLFLAAVSALLGVLLGAFGAHGLRDVLDERAMANYRTAVEYQMWHALGLGLAGVLAERFRNSRLLVWAGWTMFGGVLVFSGSLYLLSLTGFRWLGMITPFGGTALIVAWFLLALACRRLPAEP